MKSRAIIQIGAAVLGLLGFAILASQEVRAQSSVLPFFYNSSGVKVAVGSSQPLPITGSISASLGGFAPNGSYGTLTATASSSGSTALPTGTDVALQNTSTVDVSCVLATGSATATTNKIVVRGGATVFVTVGSNVNVACINQTGSASNVVVLMGGAGLGTNFGGGGGAGAITIASGGVASGAFASGSMASGAFASGSIGSGAIASGAVASGAVSSGAYAAGALAAGSFAAGAGIDGWDLTQGAKADAACATAASTACSIVSLVKFLNTAATASIPAGSALIGKVGLDQTTPGTTNAVATYNGGSLYETVAASTTAQVMGGSGAIGDYLSHCVAYPTSTSPGVVTVFDNANAAATNVIAFAGGSSSISNLVPFAFPVGAFSVSGAWKVTTGANVVVTCYGKFT